MMGLLPFLITCAVVGWFAQTQRGRTGALWGAMTFVPGFILWLALTAAEAAQGPNAEFDTYPAMAAFIGGVVISAIVGVGMLLIVWTLPRPKP